MSGLAGIYHLDGKPADKRARKGLQAATNLANKKKKRR